MKKIAAFLYLFSIISLYGQNINGPSVFKLDNPTKIITLSDIKIPGEAPYLFSNGKRLFLNWTQSDPVNHRDNVLMWSAFNYKKMQFSSPVGIPVSKGLQVHEESMAKLGQDKSGTLWAIYRRRLPDTRSRFGGILFYVFSTDNGQTWSGEHRLVADNTSDSQSFYDIGLLPDGNLGLTWLDSRSRRKGKTLYFAKSNEHHNFAYRKPIAFSTCECCRTDLFADPAGNINVAYRNQIEPDEEGFDGMGNVEIRDMYFLFSSDGGKNFSKPQPISRDNWHVAGCPHTGPSLAYDGNNLGAIWFTGKPGSSGLYFAYREGDAFLPRILVDHDGAHPQMIGSAGTFYAVYEQYYETNGHGYSRIILDVITDKGHQQQLWEISEPLSNNTHPVVAFANKNHLVIAWTNINTRIPKIQYTIIDARLLNKP